MSLLKEDSLCLETIVRDVGTIVERGVFHWRSVGTIDFSMSVNVTRCTIGFVVPFVDVGLVDRSGMNDPLCFSAVLRKSQGRS